MKKLMFAAFAASVFSAFAQELAAPAKIELPVREMTNEKAYKFTGGYLKKEGVGKGAIGFINCQKKVDASVIDDTTGRIRKLMHFATSTATADKMTFATASKLMADAKANAAIFLVDEPDWPMLLVAHEAKYAVVNVTPLVTEGADKKLVEKRCRQVLWRAYATLGGSSPTDSSSCVMNPAFSLADLDKMPWDMISMEPLAVLIPHYGRMGIEQYQFPTYRQAVKGGWAPAPTNDIQKAIWDKVRELPKHPLKLEK